MQNERDTMNLRKEIPLILTDLFEPNIRRIVEEKQEEHQPILFLFTPRTNEQGVEGFSVQLADASPFHQSADTKAALADFMVSVIADSDVAIVAHVCEAWCVKCENSEDAERSRAAGGEVKDMPGSYEVVLVQFVAKGNITAFASFDIGSKDGRRTLGAPKLIFNGEEGNSFEGRMVATDTAAPHSVH